MVKDILCVKNVLKKKHDRRWLKTNIESNHEKNRRVYANFSDVQKVHRRRKKRGTYFFSFLAIRLTRFWQRRKTRLSSEKELQMHTTLSRQLSWNDGSIEGVIVIDGLLVSLFNGISTFVVIECVIITLLWSRVFYFE